MIHKDDRLVPDDGFFDGRQALDDREQLQHLRCRGEQRGDERLHLLRQKQEQLIVELLCCELLQVGDEFAERGRAAHGVGHHGQSLHGVHLRFGVPLLHLRPKQVEGTHAG